MKRAIAAGLLYLPLLVLTLGCGRAKEPEAPRSPRPAATPEEAGALGSRDEGGPTTLAEAEQLLEQARAELDRWAMNEQASADAVPGATAGAPAPRPAPEPARSRSERAAAAGEDEAAGAAPASAPEARSGCDTACKAFASLERASDAVCRLDTSGGERCTRARQIRDDAARRVQSCGCTR